jgi:hypothetical protein
VAENHAMGGVAGRLQPPRIGKIGQATEHIPPGSVALWDRPRGPFFTVSFRLLLQWITSTAKRAP